MEETKCDSSFMTNQNNNLRQCLKLFNNVEKNIIRRASIIGNTMVIKNENENVFIKDNNGIFSIYLIRESVIIDSKKTTNYNELVNFLVTFLK